MSHYPPKMGGGPPRVMVSREGQLLGLDVRSLDHGRPFFDFGLVMRGKRLRRLLDMGYEFLPNLYNPLLHGWVAQRLDHGRAKSLADMRRRSLWHPHPSPSENMEWGTTSFFDCGNFRQ